MRKCPVCKKEIKGNAKKQYCSHKCKKYYENNKNKKPVAKTVKLKQKPVDRPEGLNKSASAYWDKVAPTVIERGHLNVLSEDAFAELCDLHSRLKDINAMINAGITQECRECGSKISMPGNRALLQIDDKWSANDNSETRTFKESALSDLKRKYSRQFLEYCKSFYLTPLSNRGDFGLGNGKEKEKDEFFE